MEKDVLCATMTMTITVGVDLFFSWGVFLLVLYHIAAKFNKLKSSVCVCALCPCVRWRLVAWPPLNFLVKCALGDCHEGVLVYRLHFSIAVGVVVFNSFHSWLKATQQQISRDVSEDYLSHTVMYTAHGPKACGDPLVDQKLSFFLFNRFETIWRALDQP